MDISLAQNEVLSNLWAAYKKSPEFNRGQTFAIPAHHVLIEKREELGLLMIVRRFRNSLKDTHNYNIKLGHRTVGDWISEWKNMHTTLFQYVLVKKGEFRDINVRFGDAGEEELYKIPIYQLVPKEMNMLAYNIGERLNTKVEHSIESICRVLAYVHYQFIRIHPFSDGNGRIGRILTDQLAMYYGLPPALAGYPRHNPEKRLQYHNAIKTCVYDPDCTDLANWIRGFIQQQIDSLA